VNISKLSGTNKQYIDEHIPHLSELISDDLDKVVSNSEVIIISHNEPEFHNISTANPGKHFIDMVKIIDQKSGGNYEGICW
jgi:GDP-mannose 6-dehydrogenase